MSLHRVMDSLESTAGLEDSLNMTKSPSRDQYIPEFQCMITRKCTSWQICNMSGCGEVIAPDPLLHSKLTRSILRGLP